MATYGALATGPDWGGARPDVQAVGAANGFVRVAALPPGDVRATALARTAHQAGAEPLVVIGHSQGSEVVNATSFAIAAGITARQHPRWSWEVYNEPRDPDPAWFADLLARATAAIRAGSPTATVAGCGFHAHSLLTPGTWTHGFVTQHADALRRLDAISIHLIPPRAVRSTILEDARAARELLAPLGRPLWITEVGYSSNPTYQEPGYLGPDGQARWLADTLPALHDLGFARVCWARTADGGNYPPLGDYGANGLCGPGPDYAPKPALSAFEDL